MDEATILKFDHPDKKFHQIIHISDIHIRTGDPEKARYREYMQVFDNLVEKVYKEDLEDTVVVISGDIFHHKGKIEPSGIKLVNHLFRKLLKKVPVFAICGNHDYRQDDPEIPDMIESLLELYQKKYPFYYLNKTGSYVFNNIGFSVVDIRDTLKSYNTVGKNESIVEFPKSECLKDVDYKIALFHGWVQHKASDKERFQSYSLDWIGDYPFVLLGDIHKQQLHFHKNTIYGYPGSLIQQDFGEHIMDHGYLKWNLASKKVDFEKVYNPYGYCTVKKHNDDWYVHSHKKEWYLLKDICKDDYFPKKPSIRMKHSEKEDISPFLESIHIQPTKVMKTVLDVQETEDVIVRDVETTHLEELNTPEKWIDYLQYHTDKDYSYYINTPEYLKLPKSCESVKKYTERNDKIQKAIDEYYEKKARLEHCKGERVELVKMQWSYLMCYGENNFIDFTNLKNQIVLLNGKNAMGKSSFLDIVCIGLYGEPTKMRHMITGKKYTDKIIHDHRPANKSAPSVSIMLKLNDQLYEIHRVFGTQTGPQKEHMISQKEVNISKILGTHKQIICEGNTMVEKWIETHIGSMESVLMSTMMCQMDLNNFFHLKQEDQKMILDSALRLENVSLFGKILKESLLAHQDLQAQLKTSMETMQHLIKPIQYDLKDIKNQYIEAKQHYDKQVKLKEEWLTKVPNKNWNQIELPEDIVDKYRQSKDVYDYHFNQDHYEQLQTRAEDMIRLEEKLEQSQVLMDKYKDVNIEKDAEKQLQKWEKKKEQFMKKKPKCNVTQEWIEQTEKEYHSWLNKQNKDWLTKENKELFNTHLKDVVEKLWNEAVSKPFTPKASNYKDVDIANVDNLKQRYEELSQQKQIPVSKEGYKEWKKKYDSWYKKNEGFMNWENAEKLTDKIKSIEEKLSTIQEKEDELQDIKKDLEHLEKDIDFYKDLKFNPECNACQRNPFNKKKQETESAHSELKPYFGKLVAYIDKLKSHSEKNQYVEKLKMYKQQFEDYMKYCMEKEYYTLEFNKWEKTMQDWKDYEEWEKEYLYVKKQYECYQWNLYETWQETYNKSLNEKHQWESFYKSYLVWETTMHQMNEQKEQLELLMVWKDEEKVVAEKILLYTQSIEKQKASHVYEELKKQYDMIKKDVETWKKYKQMKESYEMNESYYAIHKLKEYEPILNESQKKMEETYRIYLHAKKEEEQQKAYQDSYEVYRKAETELNERYQEIKDLDTQFMGDKNHTDGYKEWIYKQKVIPLLNQEMNYFLSLFEDFRFKMIYDKRQFIYLLEDRGNEPTLDKASGYQNFIVSVAFRLALTGIGALGQQFKHLMIDEGFTACDASNIEKVPILLKSIMDYGKYHSILLMSHMDSVRECSQVSIHIKREDPYSYIHYGEPYPKIEKTITPEGVVLEKKTRGRKPKVAV